MFFLSLDTDGWCPFNSESEESQQVVETATTPLATQVLEGGNAEATVEIAPYVTFAATSDTSDTKRRLSSSVDQTLTESSPSTHHWHRYYSKKKGQWFMFNYQKLDLFWESSNVAGQW